MLLNLIGLVNEVASSDSLTKDKTMPIAIIGMACRFSGEYEDSSSPEKLWDMLEKGRSGWSKGFGERFNQDSFYHPVQENDGTVSLRFNISLRSSGFLRLT